MPAKICASHEMGRLFRSTLVIQHLPANAQVLISSQ
jgi:hypothetical protein